MTNAEFTLAAEFPAATREQWLKLVDAVLKGAPFENKLVSYTYDGLAIAPLYSRDPRARVVCVRDLGTPWQVMQRVDHPDPVAANGEALHDLENGATGLALVFAGSIGANGFGLTSAEDALARVLDGIHLEAGISIELDLSPQAKDAPAHLAAIVKRRGIAPAAGQIRFGFDPLGAMALAGSSPAAWPDLAPKFAGRIEQFADQGFGGPFAAVDGRVVHDAGGSEAQELAYVLAVAVAYLRALEAAGIALDDARRMIFFRLAADADQFLTMAKFRALRKLWARIEQACGLEPKSVFVSAETAWRMMTRRDPWVNMLRGTIAVVAAGLGGANSITVLPYTAALGLPDRFARRIARNTQLILLEESNLAKVADPAAGSGGIEDLTRQLCAAGWSLFQEIEKMGGAWAALERGLIQSKVAAVRAQREKAVALRKDALTGTSRFPDIHEAPVSVLDVAPVQVAPFRPAKVMFDALPRIRLAEPFEQLRDASDRMLGQTGSRPKIFLANLGPLAAFTERATFAKNFFAAGGIEAVTNDGFVSSLPPTERGRSASEARRVGVQKVQDDPSPDRLRRSDPPLSGEGGTNLSALLTAFRASGAKLACLCSSDEVYAREAVDAAQALAAAGCRHIYLAGRPGALEPALRAAGICEFIFAGCDALAALQRAHSFVAS